MGNISSWKPLTYLLVILTPHCMKKQLLFLITFVGSMNALAQGPVRWEFEYVPEVDSGKVLLSAHIEEGWHLYGLVLENDLGPLPTVIRFDEEAVNWGGMVVPKPIEKYDDMFLMNVAYYETGVTFMRKFAGSFEKIIGSVEFMVCNDELCLPPATVEFELAHEEDQ